LAIARKENLVKKNPTKKALLKRIAELEKEKAEFLEIANILNNSFLNERKEKESLRKKAFFDSLTGLHNVNFLDEAVFVSLSHAQRKGEDFCVFVVDIDKLKIINDKYGHAVGNKVVIAVVDALRSEVQRAEDMILRYTRGDEFIVLCSSREPSVMFNRLRNKLKKGLHVTMRSGAKLFFSASIGYSSCFISKDSKWKKNPLSLFEEMFERADVDMYNNKNKTRRKK
jgi:diguanylate cyclase (GGDEF)-like protein